MEVNVPGITSNTGIDTEKLIQDLLEAERIPLTRLEEEIVEIRNEISLWETLETHMKEFQSAARDFYRLENSFDTFSIENNHPEILTATSRRGAATGDYYVNVKQVATADKWLSGYISNDYTVKKGTYTIAVGEKQISITVNDTDLESFVKKLNKAGKKILRGRIIKKGIDTDEHVFLLEGLHIGKKAGIKLSKTFEQLARDINLIAYKKNNEQQNLLLSNSSLESTSSDEQLFSDSVSSDYVQNSAGKTEITSTALRLHPGALGIVRINSVPEKFLNNDEAVLRLSFFVSQSADRKSVDESREKAQPTGKLEDISIQPSLTQNIESRAGTTEFPLLLSTVSGKEEMLSVLRAEELTLGRTEQVTINLSKIKEEDSIVFTVLNPLTAYDIRYTEAMLFMEAGDAALEPANPISRAKNAVLEYNGIEIERDSNAITDVIPGITLNLKKEAKETVTLRILNDVENVKNDIIYFVGRYNQLMRKLIIYSNTDEKLLKDIAFESQEDETEARENLGALSGNFSLTRFLSSLERTLVQQYSNSVDQRISSLNAIGIKQNFSENNASRVSNRYLNIDEAKLNRVLESNFDAVRVLFSADRDTDVEIDYGIAFFSYNLLEEYVQINGMVDQRTNRLANEIKTRERSVNSYLARLERSEANLRRKYSKMEQSLYELEQTQKSLNLFSENKQQ